MRLVRAKLRKAPLRLQVTRAKPETAQERKSRFLIRGRRRAFSASPAAAGGQHARGTTRPSGRRRTAGRTAGRRQRGPARDATSDATRCGFAQRPNVHRAVVTRARDETRRGVERDRMYSRPVDAAAKLLKKRERLCVKNADQGAFVRGRGEPRPIEVKADAGQVALVRVEDFVFALVV